MMLFKPHQWQRQSQTSLYKNSFLLIVGWVHHGEKGIVHCSSRTLGYLCNYWQSVGKIEAAGLEEQKQKYLLCTLFKTKHYEQDDVCITRFNVSRRTFAKWFSIEIRNIQALDHVSFSSFCSL